MIQTLQAFYNWVRTQDPHKWFASMGTLISVAFTITNGRLHL